MCTAILLNDKHNLFGRNLDVECSYGEKVVITPRNYEFNFRSGETLSNHYAMIGMSAIRHGYPLYFDATNEKGLSVAGLRYVDACYYNESENLKNIAVFELIPYILGICQNVDEAVKCLSKINVTSIKFDEATPVAPLHWIIADKSKAVAVECDKTGMNVLENDVGILTNMPDFRTQTYNLASYMNLGVNVCHDTFLPGIKLREYSRGLGAFGLPGDMSSMSRFVRAAYIKFNSHSLSQSNDCGITRFFHILKCVSQIYGCTLTEDGKKEFTLYSSCCDTDRLIYYYTTYTNSRINGIQMTENTMRGKELTSFTLKYEQDISIIDR